MKIQIFLSCWQCRLESTEFLEYDTANILVKRAVQEWCSVCRAYAMSYNENPVVTEVSKGRSASVFLDCLTLQIARHWALRQRQQHFASQHDVHIPQAMNFEGVCFQ